MKKITITKRKLVVMSLCALAIVVFAIISVCLLNRYTKKYSTEICSIKIKDKNSSN